MKICICGGGNLGLVCAGYFASDPKNTINIFTQHPTSWSSDITVTDNNNNIFRGVLNTISDKASKTVDGADFILLCLPGYAIEETLKQIKPYLSSTCLVGSIVSSTGFFFMAHELLDSSTKLFGFQRVPFIARLEEYGKRAKLLGYKKDISIAIENVENKEQVRQLFEKLFNTPTKLLNNFYEASLTNSNPILHTGRLYTMWNNWDEIPYNKPILFYKQWSDEASQIIIDMDNEFQQLLQKMDKSIHVPTLLDYYESSDAHSLTQKLQSIPAFQNIIAPMKQTDKGWIPDFSSRYFTEDFPFGLKYIYDLCLLHKINAVNVFKVFRWGQSLLNKQ